MSSKSKSVNGHAGHEVIPISDVLPDPANARKHGERNQQTIRASLTRFGAGRSIVLDGKNVCRAGNGTVEQAMSAGFDEVLIVEPKPNQLVAVRRPDWSPSEATAYAIADNRSSEQGEWDELALAETLRSLQSEDFELGAVGYETAEVDSMLERMAGEVVDDPLKEWQGMPEFDNPARAARTINVHFRTEESVAGFAAALGREIRDNERAIWYPEPPPNLAGSSWVVPE